MCYMGRILPKTGHNVTSDVCVMCPVRSCRVLLVLLPGSITLEEETHTHTHTFSVLNASHPSSLSLTHTGLLVRQMLLDLGASPDYKDSRGLTPLYHSVLVGGDPRCCELLLRHHAFVCCQDENGWNEVHQVSVHT